MNSEESGEEEESSENEMIEEEFKQGEKVRRKNQETGGFQRIPLQNRPLAATCHHRLPVRGRHIVLDQMEVYYRVQIAVPNPAKKNPDQPVNEQTTPPEETK